MFDIRDYLISSGEKTADFPQSIVRLKQSKIPCWAVANQYEDSFQKEWKRVSDFGIELNGVLYAGERIASIPMGAEEIHEFFHRMEKTSCYINIIVCFNAEKNQDILKYIDAQQCVKNIYILRGYTYQYCWRDNSWQYRGGYMSRKIVLVDESFPFQRRISADFLVKNVAKINETFNWLSDDFSRRTMAACFNGYIALEDFSMGKVLATGEQYFDEDIISLNNGEVLVDCGAFIGDSIVPFVRYCHSTSTRYGKIFGFEPDKEAYARLQEATAGYRDCYAIQMGISDSVQDMYIDHNFGASTCSTAETGEKVLMTTIDEYLKKERVSFIKMDLEGGEMAALCGARNTICNYHPKLAICIYHKPEDWITIPQFIKECDVSYRLYCRGYFNNLSEIVLYAM